MTAIDRRKALTSLSVVALIAIMSTVVLTYAADNGEESSNGFPEWINGRMRLGRCGWRGGWGRFGSIEVSEEFEQAAVGIAEGDLDVQETLLAQGYSITGVRPVIKAKVEADGEVVTKATSVIVMLENEDATSRASVWVDLDAQSVTKIVILTRTVIEKT
ncbi:MAG: hypothetical protein ACETWE_08500 [Candidatus Bathyarchaeia archaeon]